jgi:Rad3-related DNA helicase
VCFNASYAFENLLSKKPRSIILTSGTLSPLDVFAQEIGVAFKYKLVNSHVINKDQILVNVLKAGFDPKTEFSSTFEQRERPSQII